MGPIQQLGDCPIFSLKNHSTLLPSSSLVTSSLAEPIALRNYIRWRRNTLFICAHEYEYHLRQTNNYLTKSVNNNNILMRSLKGKKLLLICYYSLCHF